MVMITFLTRITRRSPMLLLAGTLSGVAIESQAQQQYTAIDIGTFGGTYIEGFAINAKGEITGYASTAGNDTYYAFLYSDGTLTNIGTAGSSETAGTAINTIGQIAGYSLSNGYSGFHAVLYSSGKMTDLGTLGGSTSSAAGINDSG